MCDNRTILEMAVKEGIKFHIGQDKRYKDLGDFWQNVEAVRNIPTVEAFEGISFDLLDKLLPILERELGCEVKTHKISTNVGRMRGPEQRQSLPKLE